LRDHRHANSKLVQNVQHVAGSRAVDLARVFLDLAKTESEVRLPLIRHLTVPDIARSLSVCVPIGGRYRKRQYLETKVKSDTMRDLVGAIRSAMDYGWRIIIASSSADPLCL
jgi:hypothetical protein